ncbi:MAG: hypothetical protein ACYTGV_12470 [Planctomycetota bacterium]|jgi:hypothetical protein
MGKLAICLALLALSARAGTAKRKTHDHFTRDQYTRLAVIVSGAARLHREYLAEEAGILPDFHASILQLREEVRANRPPTPETMRTVSGLNKQLKKLRADHLGRLSEVEASAAAVLTPKQRKRYRPRPPTDAAGRVRMDIQRINGEHYGTLTKLGRWMLTPGLAEALKARAEGRRAKLPRPVGPEGLRREVKELRSEINLWNLMNGMHFEREQLEKVASLSGKENADAVVALLSEEQKAVLFDYKPCLIPPKNLRDPVRAGQAHDPTRGVRVLERLRKVPARKFNRHRDRILNGALAAIEEREGTYPAREWFSNFVILSTVVDEARALDETEFQLRAQALGDRLQPLFRLHELQEKLKTIRGSDAVVREKAARMLCDERIAPLCRQRIALEPEVCASGPMEKAEVCEECGSP